MSGDDVGADDGVDAGGAGSDGSTGAGTDAEAAGTEDSEAPPEWEAVFWDIGGVILELESVQGAHAAFVEGLVDDHDLEMGVEEAVDTWRTAVGDHFRQREGTEFQSAREAYAKGVEAILGEDVPRETWEPDFEAHVNSTIEPINGAPTAIEALADRDLHVGVISDVDDEAGKEMLERFGVREHFDSITTSEAVGRTKPDPAIFETALEKAGVAPERSLMIGDRYDHDVKGADEMGMYGVAFGAEDGPAVSYRIETPEEILEIVDRET